MTVTDAVALSDPEVAVIVAVPSATEVTRPAVDTVATDAADVVHVTERPGIAVPPASFTVATSVSVSPIEVKFTLVGDSVIDAGIRATETPAVPLAEPEVAVTVVEPIATPVTSPADDTVATDELDVAQVTVAPEITVPPASFTVGTSVVVSSTDVNDRLVGASVTEAAA